MDLETALRRIRALEEVLDGAAGAIGNAEEVFRDLVADREALLSVLGLTEHEWWFRGGRFHRLDLDAAEEILTQTLRVLANWEDEVEEELREVQGGGEAGGSREESGAEASPEVDGVARGGDGGSDGRGRDEGAPDVDGVDGNEALSSALTEGGPPDLPPEWFPPSSEIPACDAGSGEGDVSVGEWWEELQVSRANALTSDSDLNEDQAAALREIDAFFAGEEMFFSLTGPAGSGKTFLVKRLVNRYPCEEMVWDGSRKRWIDADAALCATTGRAALRLRQVTGKDAATLHSRLYYPPEPGDDLRFIRLRDRTSTFVIVDEASMIIPSVMSDLRRWGARVLLVGDAFQLPPVITGKELEQYGEDYSVFAEVRGAELKQVVRNAGGVLRVATRVRETGEIVEASDLDGPGQGYEYARARDPVDRAVSAYLEDPDDHILVTWRNAIRMAANKVIRERLGREGPLPDDGELVLIKKNGQGYLNGDVVECGGFEAGPVLGSLRTLWMRVGKSVNEPKVDDLRPRLLVTVDGGSRERGGEWFDGGQPWVEDWKKYHVTLKRECLPEPIPVTWAYAFTCHSVQGSQARRTTICLHRGDVRSSNFRKETTLPSGSKMSFSARWIYTAATRSTVWTTMVMGK